YDPPQKNHKWQVTINSTATQFFAFHITGIQCISGTIPCSSKNLTLQPWTGLAVANCTGACGTARTLWSGCVPDANGLGCQPSSDHTTMSMNVISNNVDHSKDALISPVGSPDCQGASYTDTMWSLPVAGNVSDATPWTYLNYRGDYNKNGIS